MHWKKTTVKVYKWNKIALVLEQWPDFKLSCWISLSKRSREISNIKSKQYAHSYWQCVGYIHVTVTMVEWFSVCCILNSFVLLCKKRKKKKKNGKLFILFWLRPRSTELDSFLKSYRDHTNHAEMQNIFQLFHVTAF